MTDALQPDAPPAGPAGAAGPDGGGPAPSATPGPPEWIPIDRAGRRLVLTRSGRGAPTVVLETGLGAESDDWHPVQRTVARWTHTVRYDRANRGRSDPAPKPRSAGDAVDDLHTLLAAAAVPGPYILVGHSQGGVLVRLYAHRYRHQVAGLVLVDPSHEDQFERLGPLLPPPFPGEPERLTTTRRFWTDGWRDAAQNEEGIDLVASQAQARAIRSLGDVPLLVLTSEAMLREAQGHPSGARLQRQLQALHRELAGQSSRGEQVLVEGSGHLLQRERPEVVAAAIRRVLDAARRGGQRAADVPTSAPGTAPGTEPIAPQPDERPRGEMSEYGR